MRKRIGHSAVLAAFLLGTSVVGAADSASVASSAAATKPADAPTTLEYQIIELAFSKQKVQLADDLEADPKDGEKWRDAVVGDRLRENMQIKVPMRAAAKLVAIPAAPPTVILIEKYTILGFSELQMRDGVAKSRLKLGYGALRCGVAEGEVRSDMEIETPTATLSKKGTDIFRIEYCAGRWSMSLSEKGRGLIQGIQRKYGDLGGNRPNGAIFQSRYARRGQRITQELSKAMQSVIRDRWVNVNDMYGLTGVEIRIPEFNSKSGMAFLLNGRNPIDLRDATGRDAPVDSSGNVMTDQPPVSSAGAPLTLQAFIDKIRRGNTLRIRENSAGNFGVGQTFLPRVFGDYANAARSINPGMMLQKAVGDMFRQNACLKNSATKQGICQPK